MVLAPHGQIPAPVKASQDIQLGKLAPFLGPCRQATQRYFQFQVPRSEVPQLETDNNPRHNLQIEKMSLYKKPSSQRTI